MSKSFDKNALVKQSINQSLLQSVRLVGEYRGKQALFRQQSAQVLEALRANAIIQSTESSNRIEGVVAPPERIRALVARRTRPANRSEQEIAGYREVLNTVHTHPGDIRLTPNVVLQLHRDLFQFVPGGGGRWKSSNNDITETRADGRTVGRFRPVPAHLTAEAMARLHREFKATVDAGAVEPLLLIPAYVLDFLCIHPFADGNGRMARLLSLLLLYQAGYEVGRYISLESTIEGTREGYYDALYSFVTALACGPALAGPLVEYLRGRDAREGLPGARTSRRGDDGEAWGETGHDSRRGEPLAERVPVRRSGARAPGGQSANDCAGLASARRRARRPVPGEGAGCDVGEGRGSTCGPLTRPRRETSTGLRIAWEVSAPWRELRSRVFQPVQSISRFQPDLRGITGREHLQPLDRPHVDVTLLERSRQSSEAVRRELARGRRRGA